MKRSSILFALASVIICRVAFADTFTVMNTADTGTGSLRQAITDANNHIGLDTIAFNIPGSGVQTITPLSALPTITEAVVIDGYTQPGTSMNTLTVGDNAVLLIELNGASVVGSSVGLNITAGNSTVRGLVINRFNAGFQGDRGILLQTGGGNTIAGNFIGTDPAGAVSQPNASGLDIIDSSNNIIGGTTPGARNLLSGNVSEQLSISGSSAPGNKVLGNYVGPNAAGNASLSLSAAVARSTGIVIVASNNTIGGDVSGAGNLISGNADNGIYINGFFAGSIIIQGNLIGTDANGTSANSNGVNTDNGVAAISIGGSSNNIVGGITAGSRNVISGNTGAGIEVAVLVDGSGNTVQGNFIGVDITGTGALGNNGPGILAQAGSNNSIGGTAAGAGNIIAFNNAGVEIRQAGGPATVGNSVLSNSIFSNSPGLGSSGLGIDLHNGFTSDGVTPNDDCDGDPGPNDFQNFPVLTSAVSGGGSTTIQGSLNSTASTTYRIEFFSGAACDPLGNGEGQTFLGFATVTTNGTCTANINATLPVAVGGGAVVTATATDPNGNTSEFSGCVQVTGAPTPTPTPTPSPSQLLNISTRMRVDTGNNVLIGGFIVTGNAPKNVVVRGIGPSLAQFGIPGVLADPTLELHAANGSVIIADDNWQDDPAQAAQLTALGLAPSDPKESGIVATLQPPASFTAILAGKNNGTGVGLVEVYDTNQAVDSQLANISTRGFVLTGNNVMIGGFILGRNNGNTRIVVRGIGPSLAQFGISDVLADPTLELHDGNGTLLIANDNWQDDPAQAAQLTALGLAPSDPKESGIFMSLPPGAFTAIVAGKNGGTGVGLVEIYNLQ